MTLPIVVGFTGTREGLTPPQLAALVAWFEHHPMKAFHHGCCVGADATAVRYCTPWAKSIVGHPPDNATLVHEVTCIATHEMRPPLPYLDRNRMIVAACEVLLACPKGPEEVRSGTWYTVRHARKVGRPVVIFWPSGEVTEG